MVDQTILVVEDDPRIRTLLRNVMEDEGFSVLESDNGADVINLIESRPISLVTLDIHLGSRDGLEIAREVRRTSDVPIIMVTGKEDVIDRVVGLEIGADDYITKPFHVREVIARIKSVLRRAGSLAETENAPLSANLGGGAQFCFDGMIADPDRLELVDRSGADCGLTSGEFRLLMAFLQRPKRALSRDQLMDLTGGVEWSPLDRAIDNQIARLRKRIERDPTYPKLIKTVRGVGYMFCCDLKVIQSSEWSAKSA